MAKKKKREPEDPPPLYKVGDYVSFEIGSGIATGKIVEDRGRLGMGGRRLYGINFHFFPGDEETRYIEVPEEDLTAATAEQFAQ